MSRWLLALLLISSSVFAQDFGSAGEGFSRGFEAGSNARRNRALAAESRQRSELLELERRRQCEELAEESWRRKLEAFQAIRGLLEGARLEAESDKLIEAYLAYRVELEGCA
jgi:hypothetical protein